MPAIAAAQSAPFAVGQEIHLTDRIHEFISLARDHDPISHDLIAEAKEGNREDLAETVVMALASEEFDQISKAQRTLNSFEDEAAADLLIAVLKEEIFSEEAELLNMAWETA